MDNESKLKHQKTHSAAEAKRKPYKCQFCARLWKDAVSKEEHERKYHLGGKKNSLKCRFCDKVYRHRNKMEEHELTHTDGTHPHKCEYCDKRFTLDRNRRRHEELMHVQGEYEHSCDICGLEFRRTDYFTLHKRKYPNGACVLSKRGRPYRNLECKYCKKKFTTSHNIRRHEKEIHEKVVSRVCRYCGKELSGYNSLIAHEKTHKDQK